MPNSNWHFPIISHPASKRSYQFPDSGHLSNNSSMVPLAFPAPEQSIVNTIEEKHLGCMISTGTLFKISTFALKILF